jgi:glycosyltransferase involved in cell wall biosynthesis
MESDADRRISALTEEVTRLAAQNRRLRALLDREAFQQRRSLTEKFRPKIGTFYHYSPRELRVRAPDPAPSNPPLSFAIVTPSFNQGRFIAATIDSVLVQNYPGVRYHVQDAGSRDQTGAILESFDDRISWRSEPDRGQAHAINLGFRIVSGDIMGYLNSDDALLPGALATVADAFARNPDIDFVYSHRICIDDNGLEVGRWILPPHDPDAIKWFDYIPQETMFWRRSVLERLGGFDESLNFALDWDFILRAHVQGMRFVRLPCFLACFRVHDMQKTTDGAEIVRMEMNRLRRAHLGFEPGDRALQRAIAGYLRRHVLFHRLYKLGVLKY